MQKAAEFPRSFDELANIVNFTDRFFQEAGIDASLRNVVDLCVEELFVNMVSYNTETDAPIKIEMADKNGGVRVSLTDFGVDRFDPRDGPRVDINQPAEHRAPGGLGLYLVLKMADAIHYEYRNRTSKITFIADRKEQDDGN